MCKGCWFFCTNALGARLRSVGNAVPMDTQRPRGRGKRSIDTWSHSGLLGACARRGRAEPAGRNWTRVYSCARALSCDACVFGATAARSNVTFPRTVFMQWPTLVGALPQWRDPRAAWRIWRVASCASCVQDAGTAARRLADCCQTRRQVKLCARGGQMFAERRARSRRVVAAVAAAAKR